MVSDACPTLLWASKLQQYTKHTGWFFHVAGVPVYRLKHSEHRTEGSECYEEKGYKKGLAGGTLRDGRGFQELRSKPLEIQSTWAQMETIRRTQMSAEGTGSSF